MQREQSEQRPSGGNMAAGIFAEEQGGQYGWSRGEVKGGTQIRSQ